MPWSEPIALGDPLYVPLLIFLRKPCTGLKDLLWRRLIDEVTHCIVFLIVVAVDKHAIADVVVEFDCFEGEVDVLGVIVEELNHNGDGMCDQREIIIGAVDVDTCLEHAH